MQYKLTKGPLLNNDGNLIEAGYSTNLIREYDRNQIKASKMRIKEWDYYYIGNQSKGIAFTIADNSYMGLASVSILDFEEKTFITRSSMKFFTNGKLNLPKNSSDGEVVWKDKNYYLKFEIKNGKRKIQVKIKNYKDKNPFEANFELFDSTDESMVIAVPFNKPKHFYYNQKINCIKAKGFYKYKGDIVHFSEKDSRAVLDWGRGVWTYKNTWYWSSLSAVDDNGNEIGFNLGYGFGDTTKASENMVFYNGKAYKLKDVEFIIPMDSNEKYKYLEPWIIKSKDESINLTFTPILNRNDNIDFKVLKSIQHQVFGRFNGSIKIEGKEVKFNNLVSFAERVTNYW